MAPLGGEARPALSWPANTQTHGNGMDTTTGSHRPMVQEARG